MSSRRLTILKTIVALIVVIAVVAFFWRAFSRSWSTFEAQHFELRYPLLALAGAATVATSLLATLGWYLALNQLSGTTRLRFYEGVALFNSSSLTKYVPGKVWSYALQMYWLSRRQISKPLVAYVNLLNLWVSLAMSLALGLVCLLTSSTQISKQAVLAVLLAVLIADAISVLFSGPLFNAALKLAGRLFKRELSYIEVPPKLLLELHAVHFAAAVCAGAGVYWVCLGIGFDVPRDQALLVMASLLIADVVGFLAVFVPGGLGVREGVMYVLLGGMASGSLAVVLPVACRVLTMVVDVAVGGVALKLLQNLGAPQPASGASHD